MADGSKNRGRYKKTADRVDERRVRMKQAGGKILYVVLDAKHAAMLREIRDRIGYPSDAAALRSLIAAHADKPEVIRE